MCAFISQWKFYNFISQPLELVIKLMIKMAFSNDGIILAGLCALDLLSLRRCRVSYTKTTAFGYLLLSQFLCVWDWHHFWAPSASIAPPQLWLKSDSCTEVGNVCLQGVLYEHCNAWPEILHLPRWDLKVVLLCSAKCCNLSVSSGDILWLDCLLKDEKYWEESAEYCSESVLDNLIIREFWKGNLVQWQWAACIYSGWCLLGYSDSSADVREIGVFVSQGLWYHKMSYSSALRCGFASY